jgi:hypothetical protein
MKVMAEDQDINKMESVVAVGHGSTDVCMYSKTRELFSI